MAQRVVSTTGGSGCRRPWRDGWGRGRHSAATTSCWEVPRLQVDLDDEEALLARLAQKKALDGFTNSWFSSVAGTSHILAFHPFMTPAEFESLLEKHLRTLVLRLLPKTEAAAARAGAFWRRGSPFRGLATFDVEHAAIFFGRTRAVAAVVQALRRQAADGRAFVLVVGMSGGGKSSLVRAGVLPMLMRPGVIEGVGLWRRAIFRPSDLAGDLFAGLAAALLRPEALPELDPERSGLPVLAGHLRDEPQTAAGRISRALEQVAGQAKTADEEAELPEVRLVLVVDQLEELFTLDGVSVEHRRQLMAGLDALASTGRVWVLATLRSDFYPRCGELETLTELKEGAGHFDLRAPTPTEIGQMIRLPARAAGLRFEEDAEGKGLDDVLQDATAADPQALPLLEFTLEELYQRRDPSGLLTHAAYREIGGLEGSLAKRAEEVFGRLPAGAQQALPAVLRHLVSVGSERDDLAHRKGAALEALTTSPESEALVEAFVDARLFVAELAGGGSSVVSPAHEALLRHWPRLAAWLEDDREMLRAQARLRTAASRWEREGRTPDFLLQVGKPLVEAEDLATRRGRDLSDLELAFVRESGARRARGRRLRRAVTAALAALALVAGATAWIATSARREAEHRRGQAEDLIGFMVGDLREKLEPVGRLEVLSDVGDKALEYFSSVPESTLSGEELLLRSRAFSQIGQVRRAEGSTAAAMEAFAESLRLAGELAAGGSRNLAWQANLGESHFWVGYLLLEQGELEAAREHFQEYRKIATGLVAAEPEKREWQLELSYAASNLGSVHEAQGDLGAALEAYQETLAILRQLQSARPEDGALKLDLASQYNLVGGVLWRLGDLSAARDHFRADADLAAELVAADPDNVIWREQLATSHNYQGKGEEALGELEEAREHFEAEHELAASLSRADPANRLWQRELAIALMRLGRIDAARGRARSGLRNLQAGVDLLQDLVAENPDKARWRQDLARSWIELGRGRLERGDWSAVTEAARAAEALLDEVVDRRGTQPQNRLALGSSWLLLGRALAGTGRPAEARASWEKTRALLAADAANSRDPDILDPWVRTLMHLDRVEEAEPVIRQLFAAGYRGAAVRRLANSRGLWPTDGIS